jgi:hypothetical protein
MPSSTLRSSRRGLPPEGCFGCFGSCEVLPKIRTSQ